MSTKDFTTFSNAVARRFNAMSKNKLYVVDSDHDEIWDTYLKAFPKGSNPIFRERTEHDCSCCRGFIKNTGNVVAIENGVITTIWDLNGLPDHYQVVANAMSAYIKSLPIRDVFVTKESRHGTPITRELMGDTVHRWSHFAVDIPKVHINRKPDEIRGDARTTFEVLKRGVTELTAEALDEVIDLIEKNNLYRGAEFKKSVEEFKRLRAQIQNNEHFTESDILTLWKNVYNPFARFRNTAIGTLVTDLSNGVALEAAVAIFESKVAPQNYKRPKALITSHMVEDAMKTIEEMGLESALERRHAKLSDIKVTDVLFVNNDAQGKMQGGVRDLLMQEVKHALPDIKKAEPIGIEDFITRVLPGSTEISVLLENRHFNNLMSITAPVHENSEPLFRWGNSLAWSYNGDVTDSIKQRVKRAGGRVENVFMRVSLAWYNYDDLDIHVYEPSGNHIYFGNRSNKLDVDMNVTPTTREAVENVRWVDRPKHGSYLVKVNNFNKRESIDIGFCVEIEINGELTTLSYDVGVPHERTVDVAEIKITDGQQEIIPTRYMSSDELSMDKWGLKSQRMVRVSTVMVSPNYWHREEGGNRHWFFILENCFNPEPVRGIYNEFLQPRFEKHRRVFEVLGNKTKCQPVPDQMSGIGFSETKNNSVVVHVKGPSQNKAYKVIFGKGDTADER